MNMLWLLYFIWISSWAISTCIFYRKVSENSWVILALGWSGSYSSRNISWVVLLWIFRVWLIVHRTISSLVRIITLAVKDIWNASFSSFRSILDSSNSVIIVARLCRGVIHIFPLKLFLIFIIWTAKNHIVYSLRWSIGRSVANHSRRHWGHATIHRRLTVDIMSWHIVSTCSGWIVWLCFSTSDILWSFI